MPTMDKQYQCPGSLPGKDVVTPTPLTANGNCRNGLHSQAHGNQLMHFSCARLLEG